MEKENGRADFPLTAAARDEFEIDAEMLEIFALETGELTEKISANLKKLKNFPGDAETLLEIRRAAHTLKGAAGVVGCKRLAQAAHRVEDSLESAFGGNVCDKSILETLEISIDSLNKLARAEELTFAAKTIARNDGEFEASAAAAFRNRSVVRVSLERLDDLTKLTGGLSVNRSVFEKRFEELEKRIGESPDDPRRFQKSADALSSLRNSLETFFDEQQRRIEEVNNRLARLRLVSFGSLAARLARTVRAACEEEGKSAELVLGGENLEIDTLIIDRLIEPLLHLLRNAVAHGIEAPAARILRGKPETGRISVSASIEGSHVVVRVTDDGNGISAAALKEKAAANDFISRAEAEELSVGAAFELMFLPGLTTAERLTETAGRGVGLNVVKTVVERQAGAVTVESESRKGTTFTIRLPLIASAAQNSQEFADDAESAKSKFGAGDFSRLGETGNGALIVDDSPSFRRAVTELLRKAGWHCTEASDGIDALAVLQNAEPPPRLILTDAEMPRMNGGELLAALGKNTVFKRIPVIMITSRADEKHRREALEAGASACLTKPFEAARLIEKINELTDV